MAKAGFQLSDFPPELRELIWEHTLPPPRLFQLHSTPQPTSLSPESQRLYSLWFPHFGPDDDDPCTTNIDTDTDTDPPGTCLFRFRIRHPPPIATRVCRESRAAAQRAGYFPLPTAAASDIDGDAQPSVTWFGGPTDILYYPLSLEPHISLGWGPGPRPSFPNSERVRHVGLEWRVLLRGVPSPWHPADDAETFAWRTRIFTLYDYSPGLEAVHLVLPTAYTMAHSSVSGEPYGYDKLHATLTPLELSERIPLAGQSPSLGDVLKPLRKAFEEGIDPHYMALLFGESVCYPPEIGGLSLKRGGKPAY